MSRSTPPKRDPNVEQALADAALYGVPAADRDLAESEGADPTYELAAAAIDLATLQLEPMPEHIAARIAAASARSSDPIALRNRKTATREKIGWLAAAACAALATAGWWAYATKTVAPRIVEVPVPALPTAAPTAPPRVPDAATQRRELLARAPDAISVSWQGTKDPLARALQGDVVWSETEQRGYMRFTGLGENDPTKSQYQLWLFDKAQANPVDGGVFDIIGNGEIVVPITAKLHVVAPTLFAVTVEKPGGVVVSKKERVVAIAPIKS